MGKAIVKVGKNVSIEVLTTPKKEFMGIGGVTVDGVAMRNAKNPMILKIQTPDGYIYTKYILKTIAPKKNGSVEVLLSAIGSPWGNQEYLDEYEQPLYNVNMPKEDVTDEVALVFSPIQKSLAEKTWTGFSYSVRYKSAKRKIHHVMIHSSWEIGGSIVGNTVLNQGQCNINYYPGKKDSLFTTACLKTLDQFNSPQGFSYQLGPRAGITQGFDFQFGKLGALFQYWPKMESVSSIIESPKGSTLLHVIDDYRFELTGSVTTTAQHLLFTKGTIKEHEGHNIWFNAYELAYGAIRKDHGITETVVQTEVGLKYATSFKDKKFKMGIMGEFVEPQEVMYAIGDKVFPKLEQLGVHRFFPEVFSESDPTQLGSVCKFDNGVHGDLTCASVCATHRYFPADFWGGIKAWKYMADSARKHGIEIGAWFSPHFSPRSSYMKPGWLLKAPNSLNWTGGYVGAIVTADWNTGVFDWVLDGFKQWAQEGGLDYIFTDSWANMGLVQYNCAEKMRTNWKRLGDMYGELQKLGIKALSFEGVSAVGVSRFGAADLRGDMLDAVGGVVGQNDFAWWADHPEMTYNLMPMAGTRHRSEEERLAIQFKMMANRGNFFFEGFCDGNYNADPVAVSRNFIYEKALPFMKKREVLQSGNGVMWQSDSGKVFWAYKDCTVPVGTAKSVEIVKAEGMEPVAMSGNSLQAKAFTVYKIG